MTFNVEITQNHGCQIATTPANQSYVAHTNTTIVTSGIGMFRHANGEPISITSHSFSPSNSFLSLSADNTTITISDPQNADVGNYTFSILCRDIHSDTGTANNSFVIEVTQNQGCQVANTVGNQSFAAHTNTTVAMTGLSIFSDAEGETLSFVGLRSTPSNSFITIDSSNALVTINDPMNADVGNYTVHMACKDPHSDTGVASMTFNIEIIENVACRIANQLPDISRVAHTNETLLFGSMTLFDDPENDTIALSGYSIVPNASFVSRVNSDYRDYNLANPVNADVRNYTWSIFCDDNYVSLFD